MTTMSAMRRRSALITAIVAAAAATAALGAFAENRHDARAADPSHTPYIQLADGTSGGAAWRLFGWEQQHQLCLTVLPAGYDPGHMPTATTTAWEGGGCGFDDRHPGSGFSTGAAGPDGGGLSFGPLPAATTQIRVATHEILATTPFPGGHGLPAGRFWISFTAPGGPGAADGDILPTPQPLDAQGRPVAFQSF